MCFRKKGINTQVINNTTNILKTEDVQKYMTKLVLKRLLTLKGKGQEEANLLPS